MNLGVANEGQGFPIKEAPGANTNTSTKAQSNNKDMIIPD
jgi:hypothetical protein